MEITKKDPFTGQDNTLNIDVTPEQLKAWESGDVAIQVALAHLTPDEREFLMTGITPDSWDTYVKEETQESVLLLNQE